ncbi:related to PXR1-essential protein involved in rRNA and snoRNA maturation [Ustilago bromivora]|uniref:PinX1-related protein 1 n=1 Tax=Ustilago bromivora TaxID=307758 RepID=A0A1K0G979_9BASI|nr:related to PXR1-essential protein involved in rRNA and snoRNA maturation [Ustilago bromivora]SYW78346.1 related to PXR1 - essential protein involved in rRNA and snoRNA maturation [Ustilago bromivora]
MGLSGPKQKQRLVGSATMRNTAWLNDSSAPGQRMLAQMGWTSGQSLGLTMPGLTENLKVAYKMDNKGIGAQRHEREARANGEDIWVGGGGDLGSLFERLNAANAASSSSSAVASTSTSDDEGENKSKKSKKEEKDKKDKKEEKDKSKDKSKKRKLDSTTDDPSSSKKSKKEKESKRSKEEKEEAVSAVANADAVLAKDETAVAEIKKDVVQGRPVRLAHRAKFLRAKRMVSANDLASVNEILGIASTPSSSTAGTPKVGSGTSTPTPAPSKTYPGPGGSEIALMDVDRRLQAEGSSNSNSNSDSDSSEDEKKKKKKKKEKEKEDKKSKKSKKAVDAAAAAKEAKATAAQAAAEPAVADEKEKATQIGTNSQGLFVFEYLNRRLVIRKAQIQKQKKAEQEAIFARAARVGA